MQTSPSTDLRLSDSGDPSPQRLPQATWPSGGRHLGSGWELYDTNELGARQALAAELRVSLPIRSMAHDPEWLGVQAAEPGHRLVALVDREEGAITGAALFHVHTCGLSFWIGEISLFSKKVERFAMDQGPVIRHKQARTATDRCFSTLSGLITRGNVVFVGGVPKDSDLQSLIDDESSLLRRRFYVVPHGSEYLRCKIAWTGSFDDYLASLSSRERSKLRRALRRFAEQPEFAPEVRRFQAPAEVDSFLADAGCVSEKTYQSRLLELGLKGDGAAEREIRASAARGYFLGHVLYVNAVPVAFHYGHIFNGCFFMAAAGYDPRFSQHEVGIVLFLEVLKDIERRRDPIELMDNLYGGGSYKERTSNIRSLEQHYYLIPRTLDGAILAKSLIWTDSFSRALGSLLERYGLKDRIKKFIRRGS